MSLKQLIVINTFILSPVLLQAGDFPFKVAEIFSANSISGYKQQKLILLDFWATWCSPCKTATEQLEIMQEQIGDDVFIVSVTDETHEVVSGYMEKYPIRLMVVRDYNGNLVKRFGVTRRPYAVLFTSQGELVWEGHPSNLSYAYVKNTASRCQYLPRTGIEKIFQVINPADKPVLTAPPTATNPELKISASNTKEPFFSMENNPVQFNGKLSRLIAEIYDVPFQQVVPGKWDDFYVRLQCPAEIWYSSPDLVLQAILREFDVKIVRSAAVKDIYKMTIVDENKLWDKEQINWGSSITKYIVGTNRIKADNMSVSSLCILLSNEKKIVFRYFGNNTQLHDWDFHYHYDNLMKEELLNEYGIKLEKTRKEIPLLTLE